MNEQQSRLANGFGYAKGGRVMGPATVTLTPIHDPKAIAEAVREVINPALKERMRQDFAKVDPL